jgi:hypothetical protein
MERRWLVFISGSVLLTALALPCTAQVLIYPNGGRVPGEVAGVLSGADIALVSGPESAWINPAGLAVDPSPAVTAGADLLRYETTTVDGRSSQRFDAAPAFAAFAWGNESRRGESSWGAAVALDWPTTTRHRASTRARGTIPADSTPGQIDPGGLDAFTDGIRTRSKGEGLGELRVQSTTFAAAYAPSKTIRIGLAAEWQRVEFLDQSSSLTTYKATIGDGPDQTYQGHVLSESRYEGQVDRIVPVLGIQVRPFTGVLFGIHSRLPSRFAGGNGSVRWSRSSSATLDSGESPGTTVADLVTAERTGEEFDLRTPLEVGFGVGFAGTRSSFEFDLVRSYGQPRYTVLDVPQSAPPSTSVFEPRSYRTGSIPTTRLHIGFIFAISDNAAWLLGVRDDGSDVVSDDPVFRRLDLFTVSTGWVGRRGNASVSLGLFYQSSSSQRISFPSPLGGSQGQEAVDVQSFGLRLAGTWLL